MIDREGWWHSIEVHSRGISIAVFSVSILNTACVDDAPSVEDGAGSESADTVGASEESGSGSGSGSDSGPDSGSGSTESNSGSNSESGLTDSEDTDTEDTESDTEGPFDTGDTTESDTTEGGVFDTDDEGPFDTSDDTTESETFGDTGDDSTDWGDWSDATGGTDTEANNEFVGCGALSFEWNPAILIAGPTDSKISDLDRRADGGTVAASVHGDTVNLLVISPDGEVEASTTGAIDIDVTGRHVAVLSDPGGGLVWGSRVGDEAFVTALDAELGELWTWTHPNIEWGMTVRDMARTASGNVVVVGEHSVGSYMWMVILSPEGVPVSPILGGPLAADGVFTVAPSGVAVDPLTDDIVVSGWDVNPGYNDTWVARFDGVGNLMWETELGGEVGFLGGTLVDDEGFIYAIFEEGGIFKLSPEGEALAKVTFPGNAGEVALLDGRDILTAGFLAGSYVLRRYSSELELIESRGLFTMIPRAITPGPNCRVALGGYDGWLTQLGADVL